MADSTPASAPSTPIGALSPWLDRLFAAGHPSPGAAGAAIALGTVLGFAGLEWTTGRLELLLSGEGPAYLARNIRIAVVVALLFGYFVAAHRYVRLWTLETFAALRPSLACSEARFAALRGAVGSASARGARRAGWVGVGAVLCTGPIVDRGFDHFLARGYWAPETVFHWLSIPIIGWLAGRLVFASAVESRRVAALADELGEIDLLDLRALQPFARQGLRNALLWLVCTAILSLLLANRGFGPLLAVLGLATLSFAVRALLRPMGRARERVARTKRDALAQVRGEIRRDRAALRALSPEAAAAAARLPGLLAYEARIEGVREWPFDPPTLARFLLYLVIPLGGWLGGALVERALASWLD